MSDFFISYSRKDTDFVEAFYTAFIAAYRASHPNKEVDIWLDREDIEPSVSWWTRIQKGVVETKNFAVFMSADYLASDICNAELAYARQLGKNIVLLRITSFQEADWREKLKVRLWNDEWGTKDLADIHYKYLNTLNWIDFVTQPYTEALQKVITTIDQDIVHKDQHSDLINRALRWETSGKDPSYLLRQREISNAERWLEKASEKQPHATQQHITYILASRAFQRRQQRNLLTGVVVALVVSISLSILSLILFQNAQSEANSRATQQIIALNNAATATRALVTATIAQGQAEARTTEVAEQAATSVANLIDAWTSQSLFLADLSRQEYEASRPQSALLLALESLAHYDEGIVSVQSTNALRQALNVSTHEISLFQHQDNVNGATYDSQFNRVLTWSRDGTSKVWDAVTGTNLASIVAGAPVNGSTWRSDGSQILSWSDNGSAVVWNANTGDVIFEMLHGEAATDVRQPTNRECTNALGSSEQTAVYFPGGMRVNDAKWSPNEDYIATAGDDSLVKIWDATTGKLLLSFLIGDVWAYPTKVIWSPDSRYIAVSSVNAPTQIWDVEAGQFVESLSMVYPATWNQDSTQLLSYEPAYSFYATSGNLVLWNLERNSKRCFINTQISTLRSDETVSRTEDFGILSALYSRDEQTITATLTDNTVRMYDAIEGDMLKIFTPEDQVRGFLWDSTEHWLLTWSAVDFSNDSAGSITLWDGSTETPIWRQSVERVVETARFNDDNTEIVIGTSGGEFRILDRQTGETLHSVRHDDAVQDIDDIIHIGAVWNEDETELLTWTDDDTARIWNLDIENPAIKAFDHGGEIQNSSVSPNQQWVTTMGKLSGCITDDCPDFLRVWDTATRTLQFEMSSEGWVGLQPNFASSPVAFIGVAWHENSSELLVWSDSNIVQLIEVPSGVVKQTFQSQSSFTNAHTLNAQFTPDHTAVVAYSFGPLLNVWDIQTGMLRHEIRISSDVDGSEAYISGIEVSPNSAQVLVWTGGYQSFAAEDYIDIWDIQAGEQLLRIHETGGVMGAQWNSVGTQILSWNSDARGCQNCQYGLRTWNATTGEMLWEQVENLEIWGAHWNHDDTRILSWRGNVTNILDATTGDILLRVLHDEWVTGGVWNQDESQFVTWSEDGTARVWNGETGALELLLSHPPDTDVWDVIWSNDEKYIYTYDSSVWFCETNCTFSIFIWDSTSGKLVQEIEHNDNITDWSVLSEDYLFTASEDGTARIWLVDLPTLIQLGREQVTRELTNSERADFFLPTITPSPSPTIISMGNVRAGQHRGEVLTSNGQLWYYMGEAGETLSLRVDADNPASSNVESTRVPNGLDTFIVVRNSNGEIIAENDDIEPGVVTNSFIEGIILPNEDIYIIEVRSWDNRSTGPYTLTIESNIKR